LLTIRQAGIEDMEEVIRLRMAFLKDVHPEVEEPTGLLEATRRYVNEKLPAGEFLVWFAEDNEQIVGTGGLVFWHRPPSLHYRADSQAYVINMYTLPERRREGIATLLLQNMIDYVKSTPVRRIGLHTTEMGRSVYEKLGFVDSTDEMKLRFA
jgi:GNAT superfamily N-acetyltransferase